MAKQLCLVSYYQSYLLVRMPCGAVEDSHLECSKGILLYSERRMHHMDWKDLGAGPAKFNKKRKQEVRKKEKKMRRRAEKSDGFR